MKVSVLGMFQIFSWGGRVVERRVVRILVRRGDGDEEVGGLEEMVSWFFVRKGLVWSD